MPGACERAETAARHGGAIACVTAARHLGIWVLDDPAFPHVWMRGDGHRHDCAEAGRCGCVEHWDEPPNRVDAFAMPSVPRILRQVLGCYGVEAFFVAVESALSQGLLKADGIRWLRRHTNRAARDALDLARGDADSGLESLLRWRIRHLDVGIRSQVAIASVGVVDFLIGDRLIVEVDGRENHDGETKRHKDLVRDANAAMWGYVTLRFDYAMIVHDWEIVERAIAAQLEASRHTS